MKGCSPLVVDILPGEFDEWSLASDDEVRNAMRSKEDWFRRITKVQDEFINYETLVTTWCEDLLTNPNGDYVKISSQFALVGELWIMQ